MFATGLDGFRKPAPIGDANLGVQDKARDFRFSDAHTCHHDIRLAILVSLAPFMLLLGGALPSCFWLLIWVAVLARQRS